MLGFRYIVNYSALKRPSFSLSRLRGVALDYPSPVNVFSGIRVRMIGVFARQTGERFPVTVRGINMTAFVTGLRCVGRWYQFNVHASFFRFVDNHFLQHPPVDFRTFSPLT